MSAKVQLAISLLALVIGCGSSSTPESTPTAGAGGVGAGGQPSGGASASSAGSAVAGRAAAGTSAAGSDGSEQSAGAPAGGTAGVSGSAAAGSGALAGTAGYLPWPGGNQVAAVDPVDTYASDLSGVHYEPAQGAMPAVLWAVQNSPSKLYRLLWNGTTWASDSSNGWGSGKTLRFANGKGVPDSEGVTKAALGSTDLYTSIERDTDDSNVSRLSVLLFDGASDKATLNASREWNLTAALPSVGSNLGLEALTWVPDAYLVASGFIDESTNAPYDPAGYANHAGGLFLVGIEANGGIHAFALDHVGGGFTRVASFESGHSGVMDLSFDRDVGYLWAACDDTCQGRINVLTIDTRVGSTTHGKFVVRQGFERPSTMPNLNNEGFTVASENPCVGGFKPAFYAEDGSTNGHAIRRDSVPCGAFLK